MTVSAEARAAVYESLTSAHEGGYEAFVMGHPDDVADDMASYDADVERMLADKAITHADVSSIIADWQKERQP